MIALVLPLLALCQSLPGRGDDSLFNRYRSGVALRDSVSTVYYVCRCAGHLPAGAELVRSISEGVSIIRFKDARHATASKSSGRVALAGDDWKLSPALERKAQIQSNRQKKFIVSGLKADELLSAIAGLKTGISVLTINTASHSVVVSCKASMLPRILALPAVTFVDEAVSAVEEANIIGYDRSWHGINAVDYLIPGANGSGIVVGVKEQKVQENDIDLWKRVLPSALAASSSSTHATVIASIIGGAGNSSYFGRGIAWACRFYPSSYANLFADDANHLAQNKVSVQNHSYGTVVQQFYGAEALSYDLLAWQNKRFVAVMSAGNQGAAAATEGKYAGLQGFANLTGNFKMAKNVITVGAIEKNGEVAVLSSAGPLYDGRIAPQITAVGPGGTSDAAAIVSGTVAVMQQVYADSNSGNIPAAALIKAVLYNTADDIHAAGPDYKTGYGLLNSYAAVRAIQEKNYDSAAITQGQLWTRNITVPANTAELKVTMAWTDAESLVNNNKALINDLDLEVQEQGSGTIYRPWVPSTVPHRDSLSLPAARKRDSLNTSEQVSIRMPAPGNYQLRVKGTTVPNAGMSFHLAWKTDTFHTFRFTSPLHASDVDRSEKEFLNIRWQAVLADTNQTGNLYISYNNGAAWELLSAGVKVARQRYSWAIKDTNSTAVLKMETGFGTFQSAAFIIARPTRLGLDFNCADSFRISWNPHVYAGGYRVYALTDSPYLKPMMDVTDTAVVLQKAAFPFINYAVEPLLTNGLAAARSDVMNITLQNVHCFYRSLNYILPDKNKVLLTLELSTNVYPDSVEFERVNAGGQLLQGYGGIKTGTQLLYEQQAGDIPGGVTYFRARIKLKNGSTVYTEIIPVLTSGERKIWFYPSPARRGQPLNYIMQQGVDADSKLLIYDITGRLLLHLPSISYQVDVSRFGPGVLVYKLVSQENQVIETGKIVVQ